MSYNLLDVARDLVKGNLEYVMPHIRDARSSVCSGCTSLQRLPGARLGVCKKCGCFMDYKTTLARAECPLKKWSK